MLYEARVIVHSYEIHTGTTADVKGYDRFYDILTFILPRRTWVRELDVC
jgi:hypothetical protein